MLDWSMIAKANEMAKVLEEGPRVLEVARHHKAIVGALNNSHVNGEQDAMCVFEAVAHTLAQLTGGLGEQERRGILNYVSARAETLGDQYRECGKTADFIFEQ